MTPTEAHAAITAQRKKETALLREENRILRVFCVKAGIRVNSRPSRKGLYSQFVSIRG